MYYWVCQVLPVYCVVVLANIVGWQPYDIHAVDKAVVTEHGVKAAFLYKFAGYVDWPKEAFVSSDAPIRIAIVGDSAIADELDRMVLGRTAQDRPIQVIRVKSGDALAGVHILFVGRKETYSLDKFAQLAKVHSILLVSDSSGSLELGSVINFVRSDKRLRFEVSLINAENNGLRVSSRLLTVALYVRTRTH